MNIGDTTSSSRKYRSRSASGGAPIEPPVHRDLRINQELRCHETGHDDP
jgi:hypothetical protein